MFRHKAPLFCVVFVTFSSNFWSQNYLGVRADVTTPVRMMGGGRGGIRWTPPRPPALCGFQSSYETSPDSLKKKRIKSQPPRYKSTFFTPPPREVVNLTTSVEHKSVTTSVGQGPLTNAHPHPNTFPRGHLQGKTHENFGRTRLPLTTSVVHAPWQLPMPPWKLSGENIFPRGRKLSCYDMDKF